MKHPSTPGHLTATGATGNRGNYRVWERGNGTWMWFSGERGGAELMVGDNLRSLLRDLRAFSLPPQLVPHSSGRHQHPTTQPAPGHNNFKDFFQYL